MPASLNKLRSNPNHIQMRHIPKMLYESGNHQLTKPKPVLSWTLVKTDHEKKVQSDKLERDALVQKALLLQAKQPKSKPEKLEADSESESGEPDHESHEHSEIDWIYHDGTHHYSCSGLEEEGH